ncbi:MAG: hypothetical protein ACXWBN_14095 [Acidimicrobiales bacterium]
MSQPRSHPSGATDDAPSDPGARSAEWFGARAFVVVALALTVVVALSNHLLATWSGYPLAPLRFPGSWLLGGWVRYDGNWYRSIVTGGYAYAGPDAQSNVAYFPGYPLAMWLVTQVVRNAALAGVLVTVASGFGAVVLFGRWARVRLDDRTTRLAVLLLVLYPFAWYLFGAVYADALFLVAAIGAFVLLEGGHPVLAGLLGAVATASRPIGPALVLGLVLVVIERRGGFRHLRALRPADAGVLLSAVGMAAWSAYQGIRWGDPLLFSHIEGAPGWNQGFGPRTWFKLTFFWRLGKLPGWLSDSIHQTNQQSPRPWTESTLTLSLLLQALCLVAACLLVRTVWRRFGWGYAGYVLGVIAIGAVGTKDFLSVGRYLLAAFPLFAAAGVVLVDRPRLRLATLIASAGLLALLASGYARGYYLA